MGGSEEKSKNVVLHVGCGPKRPHSSIYGFDPLEWREVRLDIDPSVHPDIVGSIVDMAEVSDESVDAIYSSHNIEHVYPHEVLRVIAEFLRVLKPEGYAIVTCPDLKSVCALIAEDKILDVAYTSPAGPITPFDILYGHFRSLAEGNTYMAHKCGFTKELLTNTFSKSGFPSVGSIVRGAPFFDIWLVACKRRCSKDELKDLARRHFPL